MRTKLIRRLSAAAVVALACVLALAACGSSGKKPAAKSHASPFIAFSKCMRDHGVADFPDPSGGGGLNIPSSINLQSPSFRSAQAACSKLLPGGGPSTHASAQEIKDATETAECMRNHGVTGYPDPIITAKPPNINPAQYSSATYGNGMFIGIPSSINVNSPVFKAAANACHAGR
jgi:hypothetical protein